MSRLYLARVASQARYRDWFFDAVREPDPPGLVAYRVVDPSGRVERLGPWPLPANACEAEVLAACMLAVAEADGPAAVAGLEWLAGRPDAAGVGATVRRLRAARGWAVPRLAAEAGIALATVYFIEAGRTRRLRPATAARLAAALGVDVAVLAAPETVLAPAPPG